jgi:hypothetical protein
MTKTNLTMAAAALMTLGLAAQAAEPPVPAEKFLPAKAASATPMAAPVRGGIYEVQPQLKAVEAGSAAGPVVARLGDRAVVKSAAPVLKPGAGLVPGTVVKNRLTGELAYYSGHVVVLLKDPQHLQALQQKFGLGLVQAGGHEALAILTAGPGADLQALKAGMLATGWVREVRLDLVDKRHVPY